MRLFLIPFLVAVAGIIALPVLKIGLDPQAAMEGKLEVREQQVSLWFSSMKISSKIVIIIDVFL